MFRSIAIIPPAFILKRVEYLKRELYREIGWYSSVNTGAHISFNGFASNEQTNNSWAVRMDRFCAARSPFPIRFDAIKAFEGTGTLYLAPDRSSREYLRIFYE